MGVSARPHTTLYCILPMALQHDSNVKGVISACLGRTD